jgi:glucose/mannose-6-phosphate isomerase
MIELVLDQPAQLLDALRRVDTAALPSRHELAGGLAVCGMGGSAIGADLASAVLAGRARRSLRTLRGYDIEPWVGDDTLVVCASYSGNTEETLACYAQARASGLPRVAITTGGALARAAMRDGVPIISPPVGMQPRASVVYMLVSILACAEACGVTEPLRDEIEAAVEFHARLVDEWGPSSSEDSLAKSLARRLKGTIPVVYGAGMTAPVAVRWKAQLNENPKLAAFASVLPEADHNELCAWSKPGAGELAAVFLDDPSVDPRLRRRIELTAGLAHEGAVAVERVEGRGSSPLERVLSLVLLGDLLSVYLAVLHGVDPTPVETIERFKAALA